MAQKLNPFDTLPQDFTQDEVLAEYNRQYTRDQTLAARALRLYFICNFLFIVCALVASIASGLLLYGSNLTDDELSTVVGDAIVLPEGQQSNLETGAETDKGLADWVARDSVSLVLTVLAIAGALGSTISAFLLGARNLERRWVLNHVASEEKLLQGFRKALERADAEDKERDSADQPKLFAATVECYKQSIAKNHQDYYETQRRRASNHLSRVAVFTAVGAGLASITGLVGFLPNAGATAAVAIFGILTPAMSASARSWSDAAPNPNAEERYKTASNAIGQAVINHADAMGAEDVTLEKALAFADEVEGAVNEELAKFRTRVEE